MDDQRLEESAQAVAQRIDFECYASDRGSYFDRCEAAAIVREALSAQEQELRQLTKERDTWRGASDIASGAMERALTRAESAEANLQRLREVLPRAKPRHYVGECLICQDEEPCPTLALIAEIDALLTSPVQEKVT
jgi:hypothetical protein